MSDLSRCLALTVLKSQDQSPAQVQKLLDQRVCESEIHTRINDPGARGFTSTFQRFWAALSVPLCNDEHHCGKTCKKTFGGQEELTLIMQGFQPKVEHGRSRYHVRAGTSFISSLFYLSL